MMMAEIFDSGIDGLLHKTSWGWVGSFKWDDHRFTVELRKWATKALPPTARVYEASFYLSDVEGDDSFSSRNVANDPKHETPAKIYGVVLNALLDVWKTSEIDAIYFTAEPRHSSTEEQHTKKEHLYRSLARRAQLQGGGYLYDRKTHHTEWILSKTPIDNPEWMPYGQRELKELMASGYVIKSI